MIEKEMYSEQDFELIAGIAMQQAGLLIPREKATMVFSRLVKHIRGSDFASISEYCNFLRQSDSSNEKMSLIEVLTTNVTSFFREKHHFNILKERIIPELLPALNEGRPVRLWSAGCSSGQEAYSIGMSLSERIVDLSRFDLKILATDIDRRVLRNAKSGRYSKAEMSGIDETSRARFFEAQSNGKSTDFQVSESIRKFIHFKTLNLIEEWPMTGLFDVIFCRNVMIYFGQETQNKLIRRFREHCRPGGYLFLGHSERIDQEENRFLQQIGATAYKRVR